jgi:hypothetical protein
LKSSTAPPVEPAAKSPGHPGSDKGDEPLQFSDGRHCGRRNGRHPSACSEWLHFGNAGWLTSRDPELQDKAIKFLDLMASSVIFSTSIDMTWSVRQLAREGWALNASGMAVLSPYRRETEPFSRR